MNWYYYYSDICTVCMALAEWHVNPGCMTVQPFASDAIIAHSTENEPAYDIASHIHNWWTLQLMGIASVPTTSLEAQLKGAGWPE
jgi:hypothetical protein